MKTIEQMTAEIRENNVAHGFRPAEGGPGNNTWGDYIALLHSEIAEITEAYRTWRLADGTDEFGHGECSCAMSEATMSNCDVHGTEALSKPEGVGSEAADTFIRLLDMCDVFGVKLESDLMLADLSPLPGAPLRSFGDRVSVLHGLVASFGAVYAEARPIYVGHLLRKLKTFCDEWGIDLDAEYERKMAYNRTRPYLHGRNDLATDLKPTPVAEAEPLTLGFRPVPWHAGPGDRYVDLPEDPEARQSGFACASVGPSGYMCSRIEATVGHKGTCRASTGDYYIAEWWGQNEAPR